MLLLVVFSSCSDNLSQSYEEKVSLLQGRWKQVQQTSELYASSGVYLRGNKMKLTEDIALLVFKDNIMGYLANTSRNGEPVLVEGTPYKVSDVEGQTVIEKAGVRYKLDLINRFNLRLRLEEPTKEGKVVWILDYSRVNSTKPTTPGFN
ncbi:hypothetical protein [Rufibacter latericius]|nr:hypothetical protein [Rufibacter latericius]